MPPAFPGPTYRIVTPRLVIRCWQPQDAPMLKATVDVSLDHLKTYMPWAANHPQELDQTILYLRGCRGRFDLGEDFTYGIFSRDEAQVLGGCGLHTRIGPTAREIGYWIHKDFINQGLATEASAALTRVGFEVDGLERVEIHMAAENSASAAVPRKLGFTHEATLRERTRLLDGRLHDMLVWTMLRSEYASSACARAELEAYDAIGRQIL